MAVDRNISCVVLVGEHNVNEHNSIMCKGTIQMPFIGEFSQQNLRPNFQFQAKKKIITVSLSAGRSVLKFLNSGVLMNAKEAFRRIEIPHPHSGFEISTLSS